MSADVGVLRARLLDLFQRPFDDAIDDATFNDIALAVFDHQFARNSPYRAFCERRGRTPDTVISWDLIPAVPIAAFKAVALVAGSAADAEAVFRTSGTTRGRERRGEHHVLDLSIYRSALLPAFAACVLPDQARPLMLSLVPDADAAVDSSLSYMISTVMAQFGAPDSRTFASAHGGIAFADLAAALRAAQQAGRVVCLLGTSFAFVHWLDRLGAAGETFALPAGSRLMDTGGYKGRSREIDEGELRALYGRMLGVPPAACINEYGMTEMCSQFYDATLRDVALGRTGARRKVAPPWVRTRIVDPETLEPVPAGVRGLLQHHDLANLDSVAAIQTEDMAVALDDGFRLLGRAPGATPRGCSIAMDLLLEATTGMRRP
jgi:hypothetical protein